MREELDFIVARIREIERRLSALEENDPGGATARKSSRRIGSNPAEKPPGNYLKRVIREAKKRSERECGSK